jgi:hypothetical protein
MPKYARCWFVVTFSWTGIIWFEKSSESQHHVTCGPWCLYSTPIANANFIVMNCWQLIDRGILHCNIGGSQLWASHCEHTCWWCTWGMYGFYPPTSSYLPCRCNLEDCLDSCGSDVLIGYLLWCWSAKDNSHFSESFEADLINRCLINSCRFSLLTW